MAGNKKSKVIRILSAKERSLFNAINSEDVTAARQLVEGEGVDINAQDVFQRTPLMRACLLSGQEERQAIVSLLLKKGADVNLRDNHGRTALMVVCKAGPEAVPIMEMVLKRRADPKLQDEEGDTALLHAVKIDNADAARTLVRHGTAGVEAKNAEGDTALLLAAKQQNAEICDILVKEGRADHSNIPLFLRKYLPAECRETDFTKERHDRFEEYRRNAQDVPVSPYDQAKGEPEARNAKSEPGESAEKLRAAAKTVQTANAFEEALKVARQAKAAAQAKAKAEAEVKAASTAQAKAEAHAQATAQAKARAEARAKEKARKAAEEQAKEEARKKAEAQAREREARAKEEEARKRAEVQAKEEEKKKARETREATAADGQEKIKSETPLPTSRPRSRPPSQRQPPPPPADRNADGTQPPAPAKKSNWVAVPRTGLAELQPAAPPPSNRSKRSKEQLKTYKTKSGRTIYPNAPHDKDYDNISAIRDGLQPAPKRKSKGKKGPLLPAVAEAAVRKRPVISTT
ncbi:uncharacterized protein LOC110988090 [Acanthaster planci]|uniref:Uncharacterized protein LOC110988090 n=1 Tax=Acanthaster planci TaxID=133434 RepID=A0A8B7ZQ52_ACAPL|nr:uncharacterized protein LOC110988090 [Acanthaster planci]